MSTLRYVNVQLIKVFKHNSQYLNMFIKITSTHVYGCIRIIRVYTIYGIDTSKDTDLIYFIKPISLIII